MKSTAQIPSLAIIDAMYFVVKSSSIDIMQDHHIARKAQRAEQYVSVNALILFMTMHGIHTK